ncbi:MAG: chemotaxis protein CheW [Bryobacteraceae bacterium]
MSKQNTTPEGGAGLRECLATQLILGGSDRLPELAAALAQLARQAGDAGYSEAARVAQELSEGPPLVAQLQEGLARLQQALSDGARDAAPAPPALERPQAAYSLAQDPELVADFILESREHLSMGFVNFRYTLPVLRQRWGNSDVMKESNMESTVLEREQATALNNKGDERGGKYLVFHLGREEFGIRVLKVREIMGIQDITAVPHTPAHVKGVINLRGKVIPVVDLRLKFGLPEQEYTQKPASSWSRCQAGRVPC